MAAWRLSAGLIVLALCGCASSQETITEPGLTITEPGPGLNVPVPTRREPPAELLGGITPDLPQFVAPSDPRATSALSKEGETLLMLLIHDLKTRIDAWKAWATSP